MVNKTTKYSQAEKNTATADALRELLMYIWFGNKPNRKEAEALFKLILRIEK